MHNRSIHERINLLGDTLTESEKRLAKVTLENLTSLATYSATELADMAKVSKATAVRFFKRLGYESFSDVRLQVRDSLDHGSPLYAFSRTNTNNDTIGYFESHIHNEIKNLTQTYEQLDSKYIEQAIANIQQSRKIYIVGFRNGKILAQYCWAMLSQLRSDVLLIPSSSSMNIPEELLDLQSNDCVLVMDFRRRVSLLRPIVDYAKAVGSKILMITDITTTDLSSQADLVFRTATQSVGIFDSYISAVSLINGLCTRLALQSADQVSQRLTQIEHLHQYFQDLNS
ncbi:MurR/RpiR family transcriptional regulator [Acinetobacter ihumii]|uniref:MurR/RpiR family transcriptional regulator n=1 Tax=Acinetobacter ihumii TaxID=2483802 RepID=UPI00102FE9B8|nr:MurR/RpiR family transcriptional regulator [Acinetobacter ihumii]